MKIRKGDNVLVIRGRDKGRKGRVVQSFPKDYQVQVEGVNVVKRHAKATSTVTQAGIIEKEMPLAISKIVLICPICNKPTKVRGKSIADGSNVRLCSKCEEIIE
jgi:large subunit ribosomal protein L24